MIKSFSIVIGSLILTACAQVNHSEVVKPFDAKQVGSLELDMSKETKDRSGFFPARNGDQLLGKFYNTYSVPITINRIEFPATQNGTCSLRSKNLIVIKPGSVSEVALVDMSALAECHPDLIIHDGAKFIGIPTNKDDSNVTITTVVMFQYDQNIYKSHSTTTTNYPLVFDTNKMRLK